jgi:hypothetical protein
LHEPTLPATADNPVRASYDRLFDKTAYGVIPSVPIFVEHTRTVTGKDGRKRTVRVDKAELEKIAHLKNQQERQTYSLSPFGPGHTLDDVPEDEQPPVWGYKRNYRVVYNAREKRWELIADLHAKKQAYDRHGKPVNAYEQARHSYPRRSPEYWPDSHDIDWLALLRVTPELDMGQIDYAARGSVERYSSASRPGQHKIRYEDTDMDNDPTQMPSDVADPNDQPVANAEGEGEGSGECSPEEGATAMKYAKHLIVHHKLFKHLHMKYGKEAESAPDEAGAGAPGEPGEKSIPYEGAGAPSGSNPFVPGTDEEKQKMSRQGSPDRYAKEVAELRGEVARLKKAGVVAHYRAKLVDLQAEGYELDIDAEVEDCQDMKPERFAKHVEKLRKFNRQAPIGDAIPVEGRPVRAGDAKAKAQVRYSKEQVARAVQISTERDIPYEQALEQVAAQN